MNHSLSLAETGLIRPMARHDLPVVAGLAARLARFVGDGLALDCAMLEADLRGDAPRRHGLVAERFGYVVGHALMRRTGDDLMLEQLFVMPGSRGHGLGRRLVAAVSDVAQAMAVRTVQVGPCGEAERATAFLLSCGFLSQEAGLVLPLPATAIGSAAASRVVPA